MSNTHYTHYDEKYWKYQKPIGTIGGILNKFKFEDHILPDSRVLDFGCGGGFLLDQLTAKQKIGFDLNPFALDHAKTLGINTTTDLKTLENDSVDVVISNHALEHVPNPLEILTELHRIIRTGGLIVVVVPYEQPGEIEFTYKEDDINQHLHNWCPQTLGNLMKKAGFEVAYSDVIRHKWTHDYQTAYKDPDYHQRCKQYAIDNGNYQTKTIGRK